MQRGYTVKEIFYTLQGEGVQTGRPAVFCRFAGCNLWSGRESDRSSAICTFCDTDFVGTDGPGGGSFVTPQDLALAVAGAWPRQRAGQNRRFVVCTGGEPLLQLDRALVDALHGQGFEVAVETNGTRLVPPGIDWICVSPKANSELRQTAGDELKLVYPQPGLPPGELARLDFHHFLLSPMDGPNLRENTRAAIGYCLEHPQWRLTLQMHKIVGIR
jgi:7-carboxy-7-deazaguanine synthase (Cx14CxxC type)